MPDTPDGRPDTVLAFDFGRRRIGVAVGQPVTRSASALATIANGRNGPDWARIDALIREWAPTRLVVGMPTLADGRPGALAGAVREFCRALERRGLPVHTVDERHSSREAGERLIEGRQAGSRGRIARPDIDAAAAAIIAERWLARPGAIAGDESE